MRQNQQQHQHQLRALLMRAALRAQVHYIEADPEHLPLKDKSVDGMMIMIG